MKLAKDKKKHLAAGMLMGLLLPLLCLYIWPGQISLALWTSLICTAAIGFGFELFSFITDYGHADLLDGLATLCGGIIGVIVFGIGYTLF